MRVIILLILIVCHSIVLIYIDQMTSGFFHDVSHGFSGQRHVLRL